MNDYLSLLPSTFQWIANSLDRASSIPWPLWLGLLFPVYIAILSFLLWFLRGGVWLVRCAYPKTSKRRPCENWVAGEWRRCRYHNYRANYKYGHTVDTSIRRWQQVNRKGELVDLPAIGVGVIRTRPAGRALLYENGYTRRPLDVLKILPEFVRGTAVRLKEARLRTTPTTEPGFDEVVAMRDSFAAGLPEVVKATRFAMVAFALAIVVTSIAILLDDAAQAALQWVATLFFVVAWAAVCAGIYKRDGEWVRGAAWKAIKWWLFIFVPVAAANLVFAAVN